MHFIRFVVACLVWSVLSAPSFAQSPSAPDLTPETYEQWNALAMRAEEVVDRGLASTAALEVLRSNLVDQRRLFREGQEINASRIASLRDQIAALGPPPEAGATEPQEIATQRTNLTEQLAQAEAPRLTAQAAFERADGLIRELDDLISNRQTTALLQAEPAPINPGNWVPALRGITAFSQALVVEITTSFRSDASQAALANNSVTIVALLIFATMAFLRTSRWANRLEARLAQRHATKPPLQRLIVLLLSAVKVIVPVLGLGAIAQAVRLAGIEGFRISAILDVLPQLGAFVLAIRWASVMSLSPQMATALSVELEESTRKRGHRLGTSLGILLGFGLFSDVIRGTAEEAALYVSILLFPVIVVAGLVLLRFARLFLQAAEVKDLEAGEETPFSVYVMRYLSRAAIAVGITAPALALFGYANAAEALLWPTVLSLALIVLVVVLQEALHDGFTVAIGGSEQEAESGLLPTIFGLLLAFAALPAFALVWGVRWATITELWTRFLAGVTIGEAVISPANFLTFAIVFTGLYLVTRLLQGVLRTSVLPKTKIDTGGRNAIVSGVGYVGVILAAIVAVTSAGINLSGLAIVAGALSVGIGFGLQTVVSNFVSGIILLIERPIKLGDWIEVNGVMGFVRAISVRSTRIETFDRSDVVVPNADLISGAVTNYTHSNMTGRIIVSVGVAYGTDTRKVEALLREIAEKHPMVLISPPPAVFFMGFGADSLDFEIRAILRDVLWSLSVKSELHHAIAERFQAEGIEIPYAQRDVWLRNPEVLTAPSP